MEITCKPLQQRGKQWHAVKDAQDKQHVSLNLLQQSLSYPGIWTGAGPWRNACRSAEYLSWIWLGGYLVHCIYLTLIHTCPRTTCEVSQHQIHTQASPAPQSACSLWPCLDLTVHAAFVFWSLNSDMSWIYTYI
jgi:hypothetical protein